MIHDRLFAVLAVVMCAAGLALLWVPALLHGSGPFWFEILVSVFMLNILVVMLLALRHWRNL